MRKILFAFVCLICIITSFSSCKKEESVEYVGREKLSFTFIAYIIAENSLTGNAEANIRDIERGVAAMEKDINVVVFVDDLHSSPKLLEISRNEDGSVVRKTVKEWEETNVVDPLFMAEVLAFVADLYPAESYGLDLWSHGMAWVPSNNPYAFSKVSTKWFGEDDKHTMDIKDLNLALDKSGVHYDFILFDACLMASVEVVYEIRNNADYVIASPIEVWEMGFPYIEIMKSMSYSDRVFRIAEAYSDFYNGEDMYRTGAISVVDCQKLEYFATATKLLLVENEKKIVDDIRENIIRYDRFRIKVNNNTKDTPFLYDLGHYMNELVGKGNTTDWFNVFRKTVVFNYSTKSFGESYGGYLDLTPENYTGLGTYIPQVDYNGWNEYYKTLKWFEDTDYLPIY